jgi:HK97 family phage portal protein
MDLMPSLAGLFKRGRATTAQPTTALVVGDQMYFDDERVPFRSSLERDFRQLQSGSSGVSDAGLTKVVSAVVAVYACLEFLANKARVVPLIVTNRHGDEIPTSPFDYFLNTQAQGIQSDCVRSLSTWGKAFVRKQYNDGGFPTGLEFINPNNIRQKTERDGTITGYKLLLTGEEIPDPRQVIYLSRFSYTGDGDPLSPTEVAFVNGGIQQGISSYAVSFFFNNAVPVGIVSFEPRLPPAEYQKQKEAWRRNFRGSGRSHKTAFTNGAITFTPIQQALKDLAMTQLDDASKQKICAAYSVNPAVVGLGDVSAGLNARSTFEDTELASIKNGVLPVTEYVAQELTAQWTATDFSPPNFYIMQTNPQAMPEFSQVTADRVATSIDLLQAGTWGYDEQRAHLGLPELVSTEERIYLTGAYSDQPLQLFNDGAIPLSTLNKIVGLPPAQIDVWKVDGKTVGAAQIVQYVKDNSLAVKEPSGFGFMSESVPTVGITDVDPTVVMPAPQLPDPSRAQMRGVLAIHYGGHSLVKMARRTLGKMIESGLAVSWVPDDNWRLDILQLGKCSPAIIADLMQTLDLGNRKRFDLWTDGYLVKSQSIFLAVIVPEMMDAFRGRLGQDLLDTLDLKTIAPPILGIKLCDMPGAKPRMLTDTLTDFPLVMDNLSLFVDGQKRHSWQVEPVSEAQRQELRNWQHKVTRAKHTRAADVPFNVEELPQHVVDYVHEAFEVEDPVLGEIFKEARNRLHNRAIQATRIDYELAVEALLDDQQAGKVTRRRFGTLLRSFNARFGPNAFRDGLIEGGVIDGVPDADDTRKIKALVQQANSHVTNFANQLYAGEVSAAQVAGKPAAWFKGSIVPLYQAGVLSADANGMYKFTGIDGAKTCKDCPRLKGQVHRLKAWDKRGLNMVGGAFVGQNTECKGHECLHFLAPTSARAKGRF